MRNTIGIFPPGGLPGTCIPGSHSMKIGVNFFHLRNFFLVWSLAFLPRAQYAQLSHLFKGMALCP